MPRVVVVADDLTGAHDAAAPFSMRGLDTRVARRIEAIEATLQEPGCAVLSVNTTSRHLPSAEAAARVRAVRDRLTALGVVPDVVYKKVDSTLRGNVAAEVAALADGDPPRPVLACPALPFQGRTMRGGVLEVDGVPLAETAYVHDAVTPASPIPLAEQLAAACGRDAAEIDSTALPEAPTASVLVANAQSDVDLLALASWWSRRCRDALLVGSAGLAEAVAEIEVGPRHPLAELPAAPGPMLVVVGSRATASARQAQALAAVPTTRHLVAPAGVLPDGWQDGPPLEDAEAVLVQATDDGRRHDPRVVAHALAEITAMLVGRLRPWLLLLTGGDTADAAMERLGLDHVRLLGELEPGAPVLVTTALASGPLAVVTKAGGFGRPDFMTGIAARLRRDAAGST
ncbi:MAG: four-carbon acid sugar kinase family protein [Chromatiales bacterium]|nr:four-carbon acid sugar kinase family protein [Chromatiales bacterium]